MSDRDTLEHIGVKRRSGRYPWGSGENPEQRDKSFLGQVAVLRKQGLSDAKIAESFGMSVLELRAKKTIAISSQKKEAYAKAQRLKDKGYSQTAIAKEMGVNESTVRSMLNPARKERLNTLNVTADILKSNVEKKDYIDIGSGVESTLGISRTKLQAAVALLKEEGYTVHYLKTPQLGTKHETSMMALARPGVTFSEVYKNRDKIRMITDYSEDGGRSFLGLEPIRSVDSNRVLIRYKEDGGADRDGVIELRPGQPELSLGTKRYAQVRIGVDGSHYMKGMAMYGEDFPPGVDIVYNSNKSKSTPKQDVFKTMKDDQDNPFGSTVRQRHYIDANGKKQLSAINVIGLKEGSGEEGSWDDWSKSISSQVMSKQRPALAEKQLDLAYSAKKEEYDAIMRLTNPAVRKKLLAAFADGCDSNAVHLKAAALPRQASRVILPIPSMRDTEVYAPTFKNGERVVLIRHPHGGIFEIPELTVNNNHPTAKRLLGQSKDAVGINPKIASLLSGADFDGDSVLVIPNNQKLIKTSEPIKSLLDFDTKASYPAYEGMPPVGPKWKAKQAQMGAISNLITDMTIKGAKPEEIARAVKHSMVVIDAEKHNLDYKRSYQEQGIAALKKRYQGSERSGASTLISRASSEARPLEREWGKRVINPETGASRRVYIDPDSGKRLYEPTGASYTDKKGHTQYKTTKSTKMYEADNAFELSSGTQMETIYATHANRLKALANTARKETLVIKPIQTSASAKQLYSTEVAMLTAKLNIAKKNKPLERQAQLVANKVVSTKRAANPDMDADDLKKLKGQALAEARARTMAKKQNIEVTDREWEAIQAGAVSNNVLTQILDNMTAEHIKQRATPRSVTDISPTTKAKAQVLIKAGYTQAEIAEHLGLSTSTVSKLME